MIKNAICAKAERLCSKMLPVISPGFARLPPAKDEEQAFQFVWAEHLSERESANQFLEAWLSEGSCELTLPPATKRQIYIRLLFAIQSLGEYQRNQGAIEGVALEENPTPKGLIRLLTVLLWQDGTVAQDWLRNMARIQFAKQSETSSSS